MPLGRLCSTVNTTPCYHCYITHSLYVLLSTSRVHAFLSMIISISYHIISITMETQ